MIRPIDMQMLLPRTESMANTQQHENQSVVNTNLNAAAEVAKEVKHNSETVIKKDANAFAEYQYDASEEGNGAYSNPRKRRKKKKNDDEQDEAAKEKVMDSNGLEGQPRVNIQI